MLPDWLRRKRRDKFSHYRHFLVLDIETIPDGRMMDDVMDERERKRYEEGEFPHPAYHRVVALSIMEAVDGSVKGFCSCASRDEASLLKEFWSTFSNAVPPNEERFPVLITVNGKGFDIPVILMRSLKYAHLFDAHHLRGITHFTDTSADRFDIMHPNYTNPFTRYHIDLARDIFGHRISLKKLAHLSGVDAKTEGRGEDVARYFQDGNLERIARYCAEDVKVTALVFSRINRFFYANLYRAFPLFGVIEGVYPEISII